MLLLCGGCSLLAPSAHDLGSEYGGGASGACEAACELEHASARCPEDGGCKIDFCEDTWLDADESPENGCEAQVDYPTRGLRLHLIKLTDMTVTATQKVVAWNDQSGNGWDVTSTEDDAPTLLDNDAAWFSTNFGGYFMSLGPESFDLSRGFTLAVVWGLQGPGTLLAMDTPAGRLSVEGVTGSGDKIRVRLGASASLSAELVSQTNDMLLVLQQDEAGALSLSFNMNHPIAMTPEVLAPLEATEISTATLGADPDGTNFGNFYIQELMFYVHPPGEPADVQAIAAYLHDNYNCCKN